MASILFSADGVSLPKSENFLGQSNKSLLEEYSALELEVRGGVSLARSVGFSAVSLAFSPLL